MTKIITSNTVERSQFATTNAFSELEPFFNHYDTLTTDFVRALRNGVTLDDNLKTSVQTLQLKHNQDTELTLPFTPKVLYFCTPLSVGIKSFTFLANVKGTFRLNTRFDTPLSMPAKGATWSIGSIVEYVVQFPSQAALGDFVSFSGFLTPENNGTFQVLEVTSTSLFVLNRKRSSSSGDEQLAAYAGSQPSSYSVTVLFQS